MKQALQKSWSIGKEFCLQKMFAETFCTGPGFGLLGVDPHLALGKKYGMPWAWAWAFLWCCKKNVEALAKDFSSTKIFVKIFCSGLALALAQAQAQGTVFFA